MRTVDGNIPEGEEGFRIAATVHGISTHNSNAVRARRPERRMTTSPAKASARGTPHSGQTGVGARVGWGGTFVMGGRWASKVVASWRRGNGRYGGFGVVVRAKLNLSGWSWTSGRRRLVGRPWAIAPGRKTLPGVTPDRSHCPH